MDDRDPKYYRAREEGAAEMLQRCIEAQCSRCVGGGHVMQIQGKWTHDRDSFRRCDAWRLHDLKASLPTPALDQGEVSLSTSTHATPDMLRWDEGSES